MDSSLLTQADLRRWRSCARRYWLQRHGAEPSPTEPSPTEAATPGDSINGIDDPYATLVLRATFPLAEAVAAPTDATSWREAEARTRELLGSGAFYGEAAQQEGRALLGACLSSDDGAQVRIDVLAAGPQGLRLFKARLATAGNDADVDTLAWWAHVAARCGLRIQSAGMLLVDNDFVYPGLGCYAGLFREVDLGPVLGTRPVAQWITAMRACERQAEPERPASAPCLSRQPCEFHAHCQVAAPTERSHAPDALDILGRDLAVTLKLLGYPTVSQVPEHLLPDARRKRAWLAVRSGAPVLEPEAGSWLRAQSYPRRYLRLDTLGYGVPLWAGTRPYQILPFQWTCDVEAEPGRLEHLVYLADAGGDPRRGVATSLLAALGKHGPVFAYNAGFERNRLLELAQLFPDLADALQAVVPRIVDLFQLARAHYYHPGMGGSWSFASVFNAIAPDLRVDEFDWRGAPSAGQAYSMLQLGRIDAANQPAARAAMLDQARRQTAALRRMVQLFETVST
jgi:hypothetical protein